MKQEQFELWQRILEDARWYPSPHNSQPIRARLINESEAIFYYDKHCGLPAENYGVPFGFVCMGVFLEGLDVVAQSYGYRLETKLDLKDMDFSDPDDLHKFADVTLVLDKHIDKERVTEMFTAFKKRQTSRLPYDNSLVSSVIIDDAISLAADAGYVFKTTNDKDLVKQIITINQRTLFDDLKRDAVYDELMLWLRFSDKEARSKADGLSAKTLLIPGWILKFAFRHRQLWELPVIGRFFTFIYLRTMNGVRQVGWLEGPFMTLKDYVGAGKVFMRLWLHFTVHSVYLHPYGTVITNPNSHRQFSELVSVSEEKGSMAWMLFRFGHSKLPPHSERRKLESMILND